MLKKTIKYTDVDGNPAEEDAYFNLTKAEAIELNIRNDLEVIGRSKNNNDIMDTFQRLLKMSYGLRTGDGKFIKDPRDFAVFSASEAYSELFMEIWQNPEYALEFIKGILPAGIMTEEASSQSNIPESLRNHPSMQGHNAPTRREAREMSNAAPTTPTAEDAEYQEFLAFKAAREQAAQTPPESVSAPETPQEASPPRDELI